MNAKLVDSKFNWNGSDDNSGNLDLHFSNGIILELCTNVDVNGDIILRSPYTNEEMIVNLFFNKKLITSFYITKSCPKIKEKGIFIKKYINLKYWIYAKARRNERKKLKELLSTIYAVIPNGLACSCMPPQS